MVFCQMRWTMRRVQYTKRGMRDVVNNQDVDKYTKNIAVCER